VCLLCSNLSEKLGELIFIVIVINRNERVKLLNFITPFSRLFQTTTTLSVKNVSGYLAWSSLQTVVLVSAGCRISSQREIFVKIHINKTKKHFINKYHISLQPTKF